MNEIECSYDCPVRSQCVHCLNISIGSGNYQGCFTMNIVMK